MGKFSNSSHQSKPLLILSLVVSLFLHVGGFYLLLKHPPSLFMAHEYPIHEMEAMENNGDYAVDFAAKEAFESLILKEDSKEPFCPPFQFPQSESVKTPFIITNRSYTPDTHYFAIKPAPLVIAPYIPRLIETPSIMPKISPFSGKKWINFSREIAKDQAEDLSPSLFIAQKTFDPLISNPDFEERTNKHDFKKEMLYFPLKIKQLPPSTPFQFDLPQDSSTIIAPVKEHKKHKSPFLSSPSESLPTATPQTCAVEKLKNPSLFPPEKESSHKYFFDNDTYRFYIEEPLPSTQPLTFQKLPKNEHPLFESPLSPPKGSWTIHPEYASEYFSSLKPTDLSILNDNIEDAAIYPRLEQKQKTPLSQTTKYPLSFDSTFSSPFPFTYEETQCAIATTTIEKEKYHLPKHPLPSKPLHLSPYLDVWKQESPPVEISYNPLKEKLSPLSITEEVSYNHPFKIEIPSKVTAFLLSEDDLLIKQNEGSFSQKELSSFKHSAIVIEPPLISIETSTPYRALPPTPTIEKISSLPQTDLSFAFELTVPRSHAIFSEKASLASLPMISRPNELPRKLQLPSAMDSAPSLAMNTSKLLPPQRSLTKTEHSFTPSLEYQKTSLPKACFSIPDLSSSSPSHFSSLDTTKKTTFPLKLQELAHKKTFFNEQQELAFALPQMKNKTLLHPPQHSQARSLIANKQQPVQEHITQSPTPQPLIEPSQPTYSPPKIPALVIKHTSPSLKKEALELSKKKMLAKGIEPQDLNLPYIEKKPMVLTKHPITSKHALEELSSPESLLAMAPRPVLYPNTHSLVEKSPCPSKIRSEPSHLLAVEKREIQPPLVDEIHSQAQEMIEDYDQENRASAGIVALASPKLEKNLDESALHSANQNERFSGAFLSEIPTPSSLGTVSYHNEFETQVHYTPREDGKGYYFALKMKPNKRLYFESPEKNVIFVIDGSSSIKKHRFNVFKDGVIRALPYLKQGDTFNILVTDAELTSMNKSSIPWNKKALIDARLFLDSRPYRGFFINYDAFDLIAKITPYFDFEKENVIVLLTDGNSLNSIRHHKEALQKLAVTNQGNLSIFTASASQNNNLPMLDLMSTFNNGELMYSKTHAAFPRKLAVLIKHIGSFLAKDIHIQIASKNFDTGIEFYPNEQTLPSLYSDKPYMVYGSITDLKDFDLLLQGFTGDQWINIKQHISFKNAEKATYAMKRNVALQQAYVCYDYFLQKEDPFFLTEAKRFLEPHSMPSAIQ
jgi:hypothetical protein